MKWILHVIGVKTAIITATSERNFHSALGCKLNAIPTVGILHGVASRYYNVYDFLPTFDGKKMLSVDMYGLWSKWWKEYYLKYSKAYHPKQLFVSGPMRPAQASSVNLHDAPPVAQHGKRRVLLVSEIVAVPAEIMPYLDTLMATKDFSVFIKFRPQGDTFEKWLQSNRPDILDMLGPDKILKGSMYDAIAMCDVVVGSQSTGVIEATLQDKPFVFFDTKKWGDYYGLSSNSSEHHFFAENPEKLLEYVRESSAISVDVLRNFREQFFGDPKKNGSAWVVNQTMKNLS